MLVFNLVMLSILGAFGLWLWFPSEKMLRTRGEQFARRNLAYIDSEFVPAFNRAWTWNQRLLACCFVLFFGSMTVIASVDDSDTPSQLEYLPFFGVLLICVAGFRLRTAGHEFPVPSGRPLVARPRRVELGDYVSVPAQAVTWLSVAACVGLAWWSLLHPKRTGVGAGSELITAVAAAALLGAMIFIHVTGRAMCGRPQASVDPCHLYLQDAWRAGYLVGAYMAVWWGAFQFLLGAPIYVFDSYSPNYFPWIFVLLFAQAAAHYRSRLRFRSRLWPTLQRGQVLAPGQSVPPRTGVPA